MQALRKLDDSLGPILNDGARIMFLMFAVVASIIFLAYQGFAVPYRYSLDYGEAPLVDHAMHLASGQNIYRADISERPYTISNYPPLYIALLAVSVKLFGPASTFFTGRMISMICALASCVFLALIVYAGTQDRFAAFSSAFTFLAFPFVVVWSPLLRIDMLALALSLGGLCLLIWRQDSARRLTIVGVLLTAAIYTRQSYALAAPLAAFVWLLARDWKRAFYFATLVGGLTLSLFFILNGLTHGGFYFNIVTANVNEFKMEQLTYHWDRFRQATLLLLFFGAASLLLPLISSVSKLFELLDKPELEAEFYMRHSVIRRWNPLWTLSAPYLVGATLSALTIGKIGSNVNYLLELCAALSLAAGTVIAWSRAHLTVHSLWAAFLILLALGIGKMMHVTLQDYTGELRERRASIGELAQLATLVTETPGPILADEYMGLLTLQGRPLIIQPFEITQLAQAGKWDQSPFLDSINQKEFSAIIIYDVPWANERWTPEMLAAINHSYTLTDLVAKNRVYSVFKRKASASLSACLSAVWQLPSDGILGIQWRDGGLNFFGQGNEGEIPVHAVAYGLLTRWPGWVDAVAILHDDPLHPGTKLWSYYGNMVAADGKDSYVAQDFPLGVSGIPVKAGQLLGYQGSWSGKPFWPTWTHMQFRLIRAVKQEAFPSEWTFGETLDPRPYIKLALREENKHLQTLECDRP